MSGLFRKARKFRDEPQRPVPAPLAPPPEQVTPAPAPVAKPAPAPAPAPSAPAVEAPRAKSWPYGAREFVPGAWYVQHGSTNAGPFSKPEEYWEWVKRVEERDANLADDTKWQSPGRGSIPASQLSKNDAAYLWHRHHDYRLARRNGDLFREVCSGSHHDIARAIQKGDLANPGMGAATPDDARLPAIVDAAFASIPPEWRN